jgi:hypothetical protein
MKALLVSFLLDLRTMVISFLRDLRTMVIGYLTSKKVVTTVLTALAAKFIHDPTTRDRIVAAGVALLVAQGFTDHGKAAAIISAGASRTPTAPLGIPIYTPPSPGAAAQLVPVIPVAKTE